jgi:hypothetical protein
MLGDQPRTLRVYSFILAMELLEYRGRPEVVRLLPDFGSNYQLEQPLSWQTKL